VSAKLVLNVYVCVSAQMPGLKFNPMMLLHGEQYLRMSNPLPLSGKITSQGKVTGVYDKGKVSADVCSVWSAVCFA
jgi:3-hydroxyacyl-CoA dehydrogenase/3a,7a,12a-trihydroxy-5b-cholest-24-enoyl-CoA hydratase